MNTTIQVDVETRYVLEQVKKAYHAKSYDEAIRKLVKAKTPSLYGSLAKKGKASMKGILTDLRDKDERI